MRKMRFDRYVVDERKRQIQRDGTPLIVNGKTFDLLLLFLNKPGSVLTREAIYQALWPYGSVEDANLSQNVYLLRRVLDPDGDGREFVETIPRVGYRFLKPVEQIAEPRSGLNRVLLGRTVAALAIGAAMLGGSLVLSPGGSLPVNARQAYALGVYHRNLRSPDNLKYALEYFEETVHDAPQSAIGYASVASAYALLAQFEPDNSTAQRADVSRAQSFLNQARQKDPYNAQALAVSGLIAYRFSNDRVQAERYLRQAIAKERDAAEAHHWLGGVLLADGRMNEAIAELQTAHSLDPTSEVYTRWLARAYAFAGQPQKAIPLAREALSLQPRDGSAWLILATAQEQTGDLHGALQTVETYGRRLPEERPFAVPDALRLRLRLAHPAAKPQLVAQMNAFAQSHQIDGFEAACFYTFAGMPDRAAHLLRALQQRSPWVVAYERFDPRLRRRA
jgi:DNA-binding winged helix-turn-helix (wHTH) protein/Tfp pilus assembly protein PilF